MRYTPRDGSGALFQNARKEKETQPDYRGDLTVAGVTYELAGWKKPTKNGGTFLSLAVRPKDERPESESKPEPEASHDIDDRIPF